MRQETDSYQKKACKKKRERDSFQKMRKTIRIVFVKRNRERNETQFLIKGKREKEKEEEE